MEIIEKKLSKLEHQKAKLEKEILELKNTKNEEFLFLLNKIPSLILEPMTLIGGLLQMIEEANKNPELKEKWHQAAQKFCGKASSQKRDKKDQSHFSKAA